MKINRLISGIFNKNLCHLRQCQQPSDSVLAVVEARPDRTIVRLGDKSFFFRNLSGAQPEHRTADFAVFALAIISMSANIRITLETPVSEDAAQAILNLKYAADLWMMPDVAPLRLDFANVISPTLGAPTAGRILCLSGGIDSTAAAAISSGTGYSHGLLIAGADYPTAEHQGYRELRARVGAMTDILGLGLVEVETDIRKLPFKWEMLHNLNLAACLHYVSPRFVGGGLALDNTAVQDLARHPWGNSGPLCALFGFPGFSIEGLSGHLDRVQKVKVIAAKNPELLRHVSVCWQDQSVGGNCGCCMKCIQTRLNFLCAGVDEDATFPHNPPLEDLVSTLSIPWKYTQLRGTLIRTSEITRYLPQGKLRDRMLAYETAVKRQVALTASQL